MIKERLDLEDKLCINSLRLELNERLKYIKKFFSNVIKKSKFLNNIAKKFFNIF